MQADEMKPMPDLALDFIGCVATPRYYRVTVQPMDAVVRVCERIGDDWSDARFVTATTIADAIRGDNAELAELLGRDSMAYLKHLLTVAYNTVSIAHRLTGASEEDHPFEARGTVH